jgi:very-short-patch-repair endonuclease
MIDIKHKMCQHSGCKIRPNFNFEGELKPKFCDSHKIDGMINVLAKTCKANLCLGTRANIKYKGYCANCYQNLFPLDPLTYQIRSKTKEIAVRDYINANFEGFQHDKPLYSGNCDCTHRRRIDHRILIGNTLLCIETDETQHKGYDKKDEEIRYNDLFMIHSGKFVFIRFNPDKYINKNNKSVNPMIYTRLPVLKEEIERQIERIKNEENTELLEIIKLYYTGYN